MTSLITTGSRKRFAAFPALLCLIFLSSADSRSQSPSFLLEKVTIREDFQGDGLGQFASYPPAQDIGYEPSITPTSKWDASGGRSLMRVIQPTRAGYLKLGFIRQFMIASVLGGRLSFSYRIETRGETPIIEIGIAGADGRRYAKRLAATAGNWNRATIGLNELRARDGKTLAADTGIEAVYLVAEIDKANADTVYRFLIDEVEIAAQKRAAFTITAPQALSIKPWGPQISSRGFRAGEGVEIKAAASVRLSQASVTLRKSDGAGAANVKLYDDATHGDTRAGDGVWSNESIYKIASGDAPGVWTAAIEGKTLDNKVVSSELRFIVHPAVRQAHPRLYFGPSEKETLLAKTRDPKLAKVWEYIQTTAKNSRATGELAHGGRVFELLDNEYLLPSLLGYFDVVNRARSRIAYNAFTGYLTGDKEAMTAAKTALLDVSRWSRWEPPWFTSHGQHTYYPAGLLAVDAALGYDLLYDQLSETERSSVRKALIEKSIVPTYKEYFLDNRAMANSSNWISHTVGGALIAAAAIAGDVRPDESDGKFDTYVNGLLLKFEAHMAASYLPDGSYGEGISYQEFDSETLGPALAALRRSFGIDYWNTTHYKDSLAYPLYTLTDPVEASLDMGDTHPPAGFGISALVYRSSDPVMRWYYERFERPSLQQFIFYNNAVAPKSPADAGLPTSKVFEDKGNAVFRTGWGENEVVMLFRAGPNFNHHHADQGSFLISAFGEPLVSEAGWSDYYKDPYYATLFTQAAGHNTVLVDGNPESQIIPDTPQFSALNNYPRITDSVTSEFYDGVGGELSSAYGDRLAGYTRRIVFVKPYYFIVFDDLRANGAAAQFDFLVHLPDASGLKTQPNAYVYNGKRASLAVRALSPADAGITVKNGRIPYHIFSARTPATVPPQPVFLDIKSPGKTQREQFVVALVPSKNETAARSIVDKMSAISGPNVEGVRVERGSETDLVIFRTGDRPAVIKHDEWSADAASFTLTRIGTTAKVFAVQGGLSLTQGRQIMFSAQSLASVAVNYATTRIEAIYSSRAATKIVLFTGRNPVRVFLDGRELAARAFKFNPTARTISLDIPAGRHEIRMQIK